MKKGKFNVLESEKEIICGEKRIHADLYAPETSGARPAVILSHGYNGCGKDYEREGRYLASHGFLAIAIDFCGGSSRSRSSGRSTEMSVRTECEDLGAVLDAVKEMPQADKKHIFLFGSSQGGIVSALTAAKRRKEICALVMYYPAFCIPDDWRRKYPDGTGIPETEEFWNLKLGAIYAQDVCGMDPYALAAGYQGDVLIIHGDEDEVVPLSYSVRLQKAYKKAQLLILPREKHGFSEAGGEEAAEAALCFMRRRCV